MIKNNNTFIIISYKIYIKGPSIEPKSMKSTPNNILPFIFKVDTTYFVSTTANNYRKYVFMFIDYNIPFTAT